MLASLSCAPGGWLAVIGRAASPSEKTARPHIVSRLRDEVKRALRSALAAPRPRPGAALLGQHARGVVSCSLRTSHGGAYDSHHRTAGTAGRTRRCGGCVAARRARTATSKRGASWLSRARPSPQPD